MKKLLVVVGLFSIVLISCVRIEKVRSESPEKVSLDYLWQQVNDVKKSMGRPERMFGIIPAKSALIVVDMQEGFCAAGACIEVPAARAIVPNINRLTKACRRAGIPVIWLRYQVRKDLLNAENWSKLIPRSPGGGGDPQEMLAEGGPEVPIYHEMEVDEKDLIVDKCCFSAFSDGSSDLDLVLRQLHGDTLIFTGTATDVCVGGSARDASQLGYQVVVVSDGTATLNETFQEVSLMNFSLFFGDVASTNEIIDEIERGRRF